MNECKVKVVIDGLDEAEARIERLHKSLVELKRETAEVQEQISALELVTQTPE